MSNINESHSTLPLPVYSTMATVSTINEAFEAQKVGAINHILSIFSQRDSLYKGSRDKTQQKQANRFRRVDSFSLLDIETDIDRIFSLYGPFYVAYGGYTDNGNRYILCYQLNHNLTDVKDILLIDYPNEKPAAAQDLLQSQGNLDNARIHIGEDSRGGVQIPAIKNGETWTDIDCSQTSDDDMEGDWTMLDLPWKRA